MTVAPTCAKAESSTRTSRKDRPEVTLIRRHTSSLLQGRRGQRYTETYCYVWSSAILDKYGLLLSTQRAKPRIRDYPEIEVADQVKLETRADQSLVAKVSVEWSSGRTIPRLSQKVAESTGP